MPTLHKFKPNKWKTSDGLDNPDVCNGDRAAWAETAVRAFMTETSPRDEEISEEHIDDLLGDLMHLCDRLKFNFAERLENGRGHYLAER